MKLVLFTPFSAPEREVIYLLADYLRYVDPKIAQLTCNGAFSLCDLKKNRDTITCFACIAQQENFANWANIQTERLSSYLTPQDIEETKRWGVCLKDSELTNVVFNHLCLYPLCCDTFKERFNILEPNLENQNHVRYLRRLLVSGARMVVACDKFFREKLPEYIFLVNNNNYLTKIIQERASLFASLPVLFKWTTEETENNEVSNSFLEIKSPRLSEPYRCELMVDDVTNMRNNPAIWYAELISQVSGILSNLGLTDVQFKLPLGK